MNAWINFAITVSYTFFVAFIAVSQNLADQSARTEVSSLLMAASPVSRTVAGTWISLNIIHHENKKKVPAL